MIVEIKKLILMRVSKMAERLQKVIAQAGVASRRKAEKMITAGQVTVNGKKLLN